MIRSRRLGGRLIATSGFEGRMKGQMAAHPLLQGEEA